jgi:hypothetical protein
MWAIHSLACTWTLCRASEATCAQLEGERDGLQRELERLQDTNSRLLSRVQVRELQEFLCLLSTRLLLPPGKVCVGKMTTWLDQSTAF